MVKPCLGHTGLGQGLAAIYVLAPLQDTVTALTTLEITRIQCKLSVFIFVQIRPTCNTSIYCNNEMCHVVDSVYLLEV